MGKLYLGTDAVSLAARLAASLDEVARTADFFSPGIIVVGNHFLKKWLRLYLARTTGLAVNLRFYFPEDLYAELLPRIDPRKHDRPIEILSEDTVRLMVLSILLDDSPAAAELQPLRDPRGRDPDQRRDGDRRAWRLAVRLADLIRQYEYHRWDIISRWMQDQDFFPDGGTIERCQRLLYRRIMDPREGLCRVLGRHAGKLLRTLPGYAGEIAALDRRDPPRKNAPAIHIFGISQLSSFHQMVLRCLASQYDLRIYHLNPLAGRVQTGSGQQVLTADQVREAADPFRGESDPPSAGDRFIKLLATAAAEDLYLAADLVDDEQPFQGEIVSAPVRKGPTTVLKRLQERFLGKSDCSVGKSLAQDRSLQIVACPGIYREVETVYQSILHNLQQEPSLQQSDIAVLATDLARYRPVIQAVFSRQPRHIAFNLAEWTTGGLSAFGHGIVALLDLAMESFTRSRVFDVLLNPCFLARLGIDREQAVVWLEWAEQLGVYHGWDRQDKQERGYPDSPLYSWRLGLQRLRLGRLMDPAAAPADRIAAQYQGVIPFADLESSDKRQLDAFCWAVEGLLPRLTRLRQLRTSGKAWAVELIRLIGDFLAVPPDRPEDQTVRDHLLTVLPQLGGLDLLASGGPGVAISLPLVREFVMHQLETIASGGEFLSGGVTVASLAALHAVPFRIVYIIGLGEGLFPGSNATWAFDLRNRARYPGDIRPAEASCFSFLEAILAAREKLYLLYNCREIQRDQELHPCGPLNQLRRYLGRELLGGSDFEVVRVPLRGNDPRYLDAGANDSRTDVLVNFNQAERLLAIEEARRTGKLHLDPSADAEIDRRLLQARSPFEPAGTETEKPRPGDSLAGTGESGRPAIATVSIGELRGLLYSPAEAGLKRHLRLYDDDEPVPVDEEPFSTESPWDRRLICGFLEQFTRIAVEQSVDAALAGWRQRFAELHDEWRLRGRVPEDAFGQVDQVRLRSLVEQQLQGEQGLAAFLRRRQATEFCGPMLLGESSTPVGPRCRFAALPLPLPRERLPAGVPAVARLVGVLPLVWRSSDAIDVLVLTSRQTVPAGQLSVSLFEPLLFYLALLAGTPTHPPWPASADWLQNRRLRLHVVCEEGMVSFSGEGPVVRRPALPVSSDEARAYLADLAADLLGRRRLDLLPFDVLGNRRMMPPIWEFDDPDPQLDEWRFSYADQLRGALADNPDKDWEQSSYGPVTTLDLVDAEVPATAFDIVHRRFRVLHRLLATLRGRGGQQ